MAQLACKLGGAQRHFFPCHWHNSCTSSPGWLFALDNPLEFVCSVTVRDVYRTLLDGPADVYREMEAFKGGEGAFQQWGPWGLTDRPRHGQKNGRLHKQGPSFMQWRTMSQGEPRPELSAECFIYSHPHGWPGLCLVHQDARAMGVPNNVDNSALKLPPPIA